MPRSPALQLYLDLERALSNLPEVDREDGPLATVASATRDVLDALWKYELTDAERDELNRRAWLTVL